MKKTLIKLIALAISVPTMSMAADLTIVNNTNHDSTSILNGGACSDILPTGITRAHTTNVVPEKDINKGCIFNKSNCKAAVHMTNNCTGPVVAIVTFDVKTGIKSIQPGDTSEGYIVDGKGFTATLNGGPAFKNWVQKILGQ